MWHAGLRDEIEEMFHRLEGCWDLTEDEGRLSVRRIPVKDYSKRAFKRKLQRRANPQQRGRPAGSGGALRAEALILLSQGIPQREVAERLNINRATLVRWKREAA